MVWLPNWLQLIQWFSGTSKVSNIKKREMDGTSNFCSIILNSKLKETQIKKTDQNATKGVLISRFVKRYSLDPEKICLRIMTPNKYSIASVLRSTEIGSWLHKRGWCGVCFSFVGLFKHDYSICHACLYENLFFPVFWLRWLWCWTWYIDHYAENFNIPIHFVFKEEFTSVMFLLQGFCRMGLKGATARSTSTGTKQCKMKPSKLSIKQLNTKRRGIPL